jgi:hypothetical protein
MRTKLTILICALFLFRLAYGLCSEFWFDDELQIYLIGLKSFTTHTWPYYGPDLVYTNTQIQGGLQGLLVSVPFYISKVPEAPIIFLNILSFGSLSFLATYTTKRIKGIPAWLVWTIIMTTPWTMYYSTRVVNPSYSLVFSIPFIISMIDLLPIYKKPIINPKLGFFIIGICTTLIMQLHMSWVLLIPLTGIIFLLRIKTKFKHQAINFGLYASGLFLGALTLIPTLLLAQDLSPGTASNVVFNIDNWSNLPVILLRFFSFASNEIPYILGGDTATRLAVFYDQIWMSPVMIFLLVIGFLQVGLFAILLFNKKLSEEFRKVKLLVIGSVLILYLSFFFSIKGPSSHTFYIMLPLAIFYAFYSYQWLIAKKTYTLKLLKLMAICGVVLHIGLGMYNFRNKSLYKDRAKVEHALEEMDYTVLGTRRADDWGYGY